MDKVLGWAKAQLNSHKFWAFAGVLVKTATDYFTGQIEQQYALQSVIGAALIWLGLYGGDIVKAKLIK